MVGVAACGRGVQGVRHVAGAADMWHRVRHVAGMGAYGRGWRHVVGVRVCGRGSSIWQE